MIPPWIPGHIYMEAPVFTPDSNHFIFWRNSDTAQKVFMLCDRRQARSDDPIDRRAAYVTSPSVSHNGKYLYYVTNEIAAKNRLTIKRVNLDGTDRQTICVIDGKLNGHPCQLLGIYSLSTINPDDSRLALGIDFEPDRAGLVVVDLHAGTCEMVFDGPLKAWQNFHLQYSRCPDPPHCHDIMIQHLHGQVPDPPKHHTLGMADIHVIRDDGTDFRSFPWGRNGREFAQGHQCWRGQSTWAISSTILRSVRHRRTLTASSASSSKPSLKATSMVATILESNCPMPSETIYRPASGRTLPPKIAAAERNFIIFPSAPTA